MADWSKTGIGFYNNTVHVMPENLPSRCIGGCRHLQDAEQRYAPVEGEVLAIAWCFKKARNLLLGCPHFMVIRP